ncbi:MAG: hypothetical protein LIO90_01405 [Bacteroidales bacterium]|nr:hypothetical protein [Bacteroidales bacterium]
MIPYAYYTSQWRAASTTIRALTYLSAAFGECTAHSLKVLYRALPWRYSAKERLDHPIRYSNLTGLELSFPKIS